MVRIYHLAYEVPQSSVSLLRRKFDLHRYSEGGERNQTYAARNRSRFRATRSNLSATAAPCSPQISKNLKSIMINYDILLFRSGSRDFSQPTSRFEKVLSLVSFLNVPMIICWLTFKCSINILQMILKLTIKEKVLFRNIMRW